jgi:hypothetical protein
MKSIFKYAFIIFISISFSACQLFEDSPELQEKKQALELKRLQVAQEKELAALEMQKSLATIEKEKILALQKMQNDIKEKELSVNSEKELELIKQKISLQENNNTLNFQMYLFIFLGLLITVISFFLFYYLKNKRENELIAYNDNLKKYFFMKENEARLKIAEKILDTIAEGELSAENQQKLINTFVKETMAAQDSTLSLAEETFASEHIVDTSAPDSNDDESDAEIIETVEHKKETDEVR